MKEPPLQYFLFIAFYFLSEYDTCNLPFNIKERSMGFGNKLSEQLGEGVGKGINWTISNTVRLCLSAIGSFLSWYFAWERGGKSFLRDNSLRISATGLLIALVFAPNLVRFSPTHPEEQHGTITVLVQLESPDTIHMPPRELFKPLQRGEDSSFTFDGVTYRRYQEPGNGKKYHIGTKPRDCVLIPPEQQVYIHSDTPPKKAVNMQQGVDFIPHEHNLPEGFERSFYRFRSTFLPGITTLEWSWGKLAKNWHAANVGLRGPSFRATALPYSKIPYPHAGGMVCF